LPTIVDEYIIPELMEPGLVSKRNKRSAEDYDQNVLLEQSEDDA